MPRYIKIEDITLKGVAVFDENLDVLIPLSDVRKALLMTPTADVVEVVRCKDCIHYQKGVCNHFGYYTHAPEVDDDDFCSYGERKENDMATCITKSQCKDCTERKRDVCGKLFCPHVQCIFGENDLKLWKEVGGATIIDPCDE